MGPSTRWTIRASLPAQTLGEAPCLDAERIGEARVTGDSLQRELERVLVPGRDEEAVHTVAKPVSRLDRSGSGDDDRPARRERLQEHGRGTRVAVVPDRERDDPPAGETFANILERDARLHLDVGRSHRAEYPRLLRGDDEAKPPIGMRRGHA